MKELDLVVAQAKRRFRIRDVRASVEEVRNRFVFFGKVLSHVYLDVAGVQADSF